MFIMYGCNDVQFYLSLDENDSGDFITGPVPSPTFHLNMRQHNALGIVNLNTLIRQKANNFW